MVLALFIFTVAAALLAAQDTRHFTLKGGAAAIEVEKVLRSAVANAESNPDLHWNGDDLVVAAVFVDEGPTLKRWRARARGRVARIRKRTCHITIQVAQDASAAAPAVVEKPKRTPRRKKTEETGS